MRMPFSYSTKLPGMGISIFSKMSALAQQHQAINLGQGFPEFDPPATLIQATHAYLQQGLNQYAPAPGLLSLRKAIAKKIQLNHQVAYDPIQEITVTSGATEALFDAIMAFCTSGDEVIIIEPAYDSYAPAVLMAGAKPVFYRLQEPDFLFDVAAFEKLIGNQTKAIILNNPMNPCGRVWSKQELDLLEKLVLKHNLLLISDEVYEHIYFEQKFYSMLEYPSLKGNLVSVYSFGKTFNNTGWKLGYAVADQALMAEFRKVHQFVTFASFTAAQAALADQLGQLDWYPTLRQTYFRKRDLLLNEFRINGFSLNPSQGTYFQLISLPDREPSDVAFAEQLVLKAGVATIPLSPFYHDGYSPGMLRLCFAKHDDTLLEGARRLCQNLD